MKRAKKNGLCCGAGGAQMFKEAEHGTHEINHERMEDVMEIQPDVVAVACPFCMTMLRDGVKQKEQESKMEVLDLAEIVVRQNG
jgi:Fe-S oxidoreductase